MRRRLLLALVLAFGCSGIVQRAEADAAAPGTVKAKDDKAAGHATKDEKAAGYGAKDEKADQNDIFHPRYDLGVWTLIVFLVLVLVLYKFAWGPMLEGLTKREERIRGAIADAEKAREEALKLREQLQREIDRAHEKVAEIMAEAHRNAGGLKDEMVAKARTEIQAERDRLIRELNTARDQALAELWNRQADLATLIAEKVVGRSLGTADHRRFVDEAMTELRKIAPRRNGTDVTKA